MSEEKAEQIDKLNKVRNKMILESGHYVNIEIVVGDDTMIIPKVEARGASEKMIAMAIETLEETARQLRKQNPIADMMTELMESDVTAYMDKKRADK